jgi:hypothetical protein
MEVTVGAIAELPITLLHKEMQKSRPEEKVRDAAVEEKGAVGGKRAALMARSKREEIPVRHLLTRDQAMTTPPAMFWSGETWSEWLKPPIVPLKPARVDERGCR